MRKNQIIMFASFIALVLTMVGCGVNRNYNSINGKWNIVSMDGEDVLPEAAGMYVMFDIHSARMGGKGMCNQFGAPLKTVADDYFVTGELISTRVGCRGQHLESYFMGCMRGKINYSLKGDMLTLYSKENPKQTTLVLKREK